MANTKLSALEIDPRLGETRLIDRADDGGIRFTDLSGAFTLQDLTGLRNMEGVYLVGPSPAPYQTIQSAIDAINGSASSQTNPQLVLVGPGVYRENLVIQKDGVALVGLGSVLLQSATEATPGTSPQHTIRVNNGAGTPPKGLLLLNLTITNSHPNYAAVRIEGAANTTMGLVDQTAPGAVPALGFGLGGIEIRDCHLLGKSAGSYLVWASILNTLRLSGVTGLGSDPESLLRVEQVFDLEIRNGSDLPILRLDYDSAGTIPQETGSRYSVVDCRTGDVLSTLDGGGSLRFDGCELGDLQLVGDREISLRSCSAGEMTLSGCAVSLMGTTYDSASGSGSLLIPFVSGSLEFTADAAQSYSFTVPMPDALYSVNLSESEVPVSGARPFLTSKTASGFTVTYMDQAGDPVTQTLTLNFSVVR